MTIRSKTLTILPILLAAAVAILGFSASQADARPGTTASLSITPAKFGYSNVRISGYASMGLAEAQEVVANKFTAAQWSIFGQDPIRDDYLDGPNLIDVRASSRGLEFNDTRVLKTSKLNEDWGEDEIFATIAIYYERGQKFGSTNRIRGNF